MCDSTQPLDGAGSDSSPAVYARMRRRRARKFNAHWETAGMIKDGVVAWHALEPFEAYCSCPCGCTNPLNQPTDDYIRGMCFGCDDSRHSGLEDSSSE